MHKATRGALVTNLPSDFIDELREQEVSYLRETDPARQSGFHGGNARWRIERGLILDAVDGDGDFLDVGCANGYLLECLVQWGRERNLRITPYGLDIGPGLIDLARKRIPAYAANLWVGNAWDWQPPRRFRYVYSLYDCVPEPMFADYVRHLLDRCIEPGGTLIVGAYGSYSRQEPARDIGADLAAAGFRVIGSSARGHLPAMPVARIAWVRP
jgi:SAM-dependent methyltransferase